MNLMIDLQSQKNRHEPLLEEKLAGFIVLFNMFGIIALAVFSAVEEIFVPLFILMVIFLPITFLITTWIVIFRRKPKESGWWVRLIGYTVMYLGVALVTHFFYLIILYRRYFG